VVKQPFVSEFLGVMRRKKKWWLIPLVAGLAIVVGLLFLNRSAGNGPFLYPQF
jgi:hypothetical protein